MNSKAGLGRWLAAVAALAFVVAACGSTSTTTATSKGTVTVGGFAFTESSVLAELYGQALAHDGFDVKYRLKLGTREVEAPARSADHTTTGPGAPRLEGPFLAIERRPRLHCGGAGR